MYKIILGFKHPLTSTMRKRCLNLLYDHYTNLPSKLIFNEKTNRMDLKRKTKQKRNFENKYFYSSFKNLNIENCELEFKLNFNFHKIKKWSLFFSWFFYRLKKFEFTKTGKKLFFSKNKTVNACSPTRKQRWFGAKALLKLHVAVESFARRSRSLTLYVVESFLLEFGQLDGDTRHLYELQWSFAVFERLHQIQDLAAHHRHLLFKSWLVKAFIFL